MHKPTAASSETSGGGLGHQDDGMKKPIRRPAGQSSAALPYKAEHLIWEPGFGRRFLLSLVLCAAVLFAAKHSQEA